MTSHHFDDLHPAMRPGGRAGSFDYFGYVAEGRVKPKRIVSPGDVLVDCLRNSHRAHARFGEFRGNPERVLSTAHHNCIKPKLFDVFDYFRGAILEASILH